jgi:hypothetical protein
MKYLLVGEVVIEKSAGAGRFLAGKYLRNFPEFNAAFSLYFVVFLWYKLKLFPYKRRLYLCKFQGKGAGLHNTFLQ